MFKKPTDVDVSKSSALGGKDVKKFRQRVLSLLRSLDERAFEELFPSKHIVKTKLAIGCVVYVNVDGNPMILDPSNDHLDVAVPTIYALSLIPTLIPSIECNACAVSSTMMRGSDLFLQGIHRDSIGEAFLGGQLRSIVVPGNPVPFAVGKMAVSMREAEEAGFQGRGVVSLHYYGDELWKTGDRVAPNDGFGASSVGPCATADGLAQELDDKAALDGGNVDGHADARRPTHDDVIMNVCTGALRATKSGELPMTIDNFLTRKMTPLKPKGMASLDMKRSKWKRVAKLLDECADEGMCTMKNVRKEMSIVDINRDHELLKTWVPLVLDCSDGDGNGNEEVKSRVRVMYKAPSVFLPLLGLEHKSQLISEQDVDKKLREYCHSYESSGVDEFLLAELFGKKERESVDAVGVPMEEIRERLLGKLTKQSIFERVDPKTNNLIQVTYKGTMVPLTMSVLKRQGRLYTVITNFEAYGFDAKELSDALQKRMKTSCFVADAKESKSGASEVCMLGDWVGKRAGDHYLPSYFLAQGLDKSMLNLDTGKKKK